MIVQVRMSSRQLLLVTVATDTPFTGVDAIRPWPLPVQQLWEEDGL